MGGGGGGGGLSEIKGGATFRACVVASRLQEGQFWLGSDLGEDDSLELVLVL